MTRRAGMMLGAAGLAILAIPVLFGWVPRNDVYGVRVPATLSDPDLWYRANAFGGAMLLAAAAVCVLSLRLLPRTAPRWSETAVFAAPFVLAAGATLLYVALVDAH